MAEKGTVCVTGAGGYLGSWVVKLLLSKGYTVHGTVRNPEDEKYAHLKKLEKNLKLFKADLLDYDSLCAAIKGCTGVFHVASPVPTSSVENPEVELLEPAIKGTLNVLKASSEAKVKRVIVVSSAAAVFLNPSWPKGKEKDESCWSDKEVCRKTGNWYCLSKTEAEAQAFEYAKSNGLDIVTVCPTYILGPMLQTTMNSSSMILLKLLKDGHETTENRFRALVDVRDVAEALLLAYERPEAEGRYICTSYTMMTDELVEKLKNMYPNYKYPKNFTDEGPSAPLSSKKLQKLGWTYRPLEETIVDSVKHYEEAGLLA